MWAFAFTILILIGSLHESKGTLSRTTGIKSNGNLQTLLINNIAKTPKDKDLPGTRIVTEAPPPSLSTGLPTILKNDHNSNSSRFKLDQYAPVENNAKSHRAVEVTVVICGVAILIFVSSMAIRSCYYIYKKYKNLTRQPSASVIYRNTPHPTAQLGVGGASGTSILTVMPGHFVLQPCFTRQSGSRPGIVSSSTDSRSGSNQPRPSYQGLPVPFSHETLDDVHVVRCVRPETPPPPYPGLEK